MLHDQKAEFQSEQARLAMKELLRKSQSRSEMQDGALTKKASRGAGGCKMCWQPK